MIDHPEPGVEPFTDPTQRVAGQPKPDLPLDPAPARPRTGHARVDAALDRLEDLRDRPAADHVEIYEDVHRRLQEALADPDGG